MLVLGLIYQGALMTNEYKYNPTANDQKIEADRELKGRKKALRENLLTIRAKMAPTVREDKSQKIVDAIFNTEAYAKAKTIFSFYPINDELRVDYLFEPALAAGKKICFPVTFTKGRMEAYIPQDLNKMPKDRFGIPSPDPKESAFVDPEDIDLVLVPMLGFDRKCLRIGYGGGFYDRFLPRLSPKATIIGVAFSNQEVVTIPHDQYDFVLPQIITDKEIISSPTNSIKDDDALSNKP